MMAKTWVVADPHFGHKLMEKLRPWDTIKEHDEALVDNWNNVVRDGDRVYVLGDLCMNRRYISTIDKCNGRKVLVKGNHDIFKLKDYFPFFDDIRACVVKPKIGVIMTHIPIHPGQLEYRFKLNIHGHCHEHVVQRQPHDAFGMPMGDRVPDSRYRCVSMEQIGYTPLDFQEIIDDCKERFG
jgi:calcineurin-like phosphoesterase family protein